MNMSESIKFRRFYFPVLCAVFAGASLFLRFTSSFDDYYTLLGFHLQKQGLSSLLLFLAMFTVSIPAYATSQSKVAKVSLLITVGGALLFTILLVSPTMIKFNQRVNNGTLVERPGSLTPLMMSASQGDLQEMERLIKSGANVNARNDVNNTALHFAVGATPIQNHNGSPQAVAFLIEQGADANAENNTKITPLMDAVVNDGLESLKILIAHGADVNKVSKYDETALSMAVLRAHSQFADPPSMKPFVRRYSDIAIELLRHGADPNFKDFTGRTVLQTAEKYHEDVLVKELREHGARE